MSRESRFKTSGKGTGMSGTGATEAQNITVINRGYEAFGKGDIETLKTLFAPNAIWHSIGAGVLPGNYRGLQAILQFFGQLAHETHGTVRAELQTVQQNCRVFGDMLTEINNGHENPADIELLEVFLKFIKYRTSSYIVTTCNLTGVLPH